VVGDGEAGHPEFVGAVEQFFDGRQAVQDGILGMYVKVNESHKAIPIVRNKDKHFFPNPPKEVFNNLETAGPYSGSS